MRFLGRRVPQFGAQVHGNFEGEVTSSLKERAEGVRIRTNGDDDNKREYDAMPEEDDEDPTSPRTSASSVEPLRWAS